MPIEAPPKYGGTGWPQRSPVDGRPGFPETFLEDPPRGVRIAIPQWQEIRLSGETIYDANVELDPDFGTIG